MRRPHAETGTAEGKTKAVGRNMSGEAKPKAVPESIQEQE